MALRAYTRNELLALTPDRYLADGFGDLAALQGEFATAAANQLLEGGAPPQEVAFTASALEETMDLHDGAPQDRAESAVQEALGVVARLIRQPNNERLAEWLEECAARVTQPGDVAAFLAHVDAVMKQYAVMSSFYSPEDSSSPASPS